MRDGKVMITGGRWPPLAIHEGVDATYETEIEIFDPATNIISVAGKMNKPRYNHAVVQLIDGKVLLVSGSTSDEESDSGLQLTSTVELYDPVSKKCLIVGQLNDARHNPQALPLAGNKALIFDGQDDEYYDDASKTPTPRVELFTPKGKEPSSEKSTK